jgi:hypothetical protein
MNTELTNEQAEELARMGWKLVPVEPTEEMIDKAEDLDWSDDDVRGNCYRQWRVMVATAPARLQAQNIAIGDGRAEFEAYAYQMGSRDFELNEFGGYKNSHTADKWWFWKSSRDELKIRLAAPTPPSAPVQQSVREAFEAWLEREMPVGTVIGDPKWWAIRILRALSASPAGNKVEGEVFANKLDEIRSIYEFSVDDDGALRDAAGMLRSIRVAHPQPPQPDSNELVEALRRLEVSAITVDYCYRSNPGNFASALSGLVESADGARAALSQYYKKEG